MREIPPEYLVAGTTRIDLRKDIEKKLREEKDKIKEIRFREVGFNQSKLDLNLELKITKYKASGGKEYFLELVNKNDVLFGLLRLRIIKNKAIVRELHIYGQSLKIGEKGKISQHKGLGKMLMKEAEKISKKEKIKKIYVISGIGVREYYKNLGYNLEDTYIVKEL
jgi:elongator complex protein 3